MIKKVKASELKVGDMVTCCGYPFRKVKNICKYGGGFTRQIEFFDGPDALGDFDDMFEIKTEETDMSDKIEEFKERALTALYDLNGTLDIIRQDIDGEYIPDLQCVEKYFNREVPEMISALRALVNAREEQEGIKKLIDESEKLKEWAENLREEALKELEAAKSKLEKPNEKWVYKRAHELKEGDIIKYKGFVLQVKRLHAVIPTSRYHLKTDFDDFMIHKDEIIEVLEKNNEHK